MACCSQPTITDAAFAHLKGIHTLNMAIAPGHHHGCRLHPPQGHPHSEYGLLQPATITDAAFAHLKGIHSLSLYGCIN
jgi:hypothetical protein